MYYDVCCSVIAWHAALAMPPPQGQAMVQGVVEFYKQLISRVTAASFYYQSPPYFADSVIGIP